MAIASNVEVADWLRSSLELLGYRVTIAAAPTSPDDCNPDILLLEDEAIERSLVAGAVVAAFPNVPTLTFGGGSDLHFPCPLRELCAAIELAIAHQHPPNQLTIPDRGCPDTLVNRQHFERLISATTNAISLIDRHYIYQLVNKTYEIWHARSQAEIVGHHVAELLGKEVFETIVRDRCDRCLAGEAIQYEAWFDLAGIGRQFLGVTYSPYRESDGTISGIVVGLRNLTQLKRTEDSLKFQAAILEQIHDAAIVADPHGKITYWNRGAEAIYGYTAAEAIGQNTAMLYFPEDLHLMHTQVFEPLMRQGHCEVVLPKRTKTGDRIYVELRLSLLCDEKGDVVGAIGCSNDITAQTQAQQQLRASEETLAKILNTSPIVHYIYDLHEQRNLYANRAFAEILGYPVEQLQAWGSDVLEILFHPDDLPNALGRSEQWKDEPNDRISSYEYRLRRADGSWARFHSREIPFLRDAAGNVRQILGAALDITERAIAQEREQELEQERALNALRAQFFAMLSHELRTPLATILASAGGLLMPAPMSAPMPAMRLDENRRKLERILDCARYMQELVENSLTFGRAESGTLVASPIPLELETFCRQLLMEIARNYNRESDALLSCAVFDTPIALDETLLRTILSNLLVNAFKFSTPGTPVKLSAKLAVKTAVDLGVDPTRIVLAVCDRGCGIAEEHLPHIFKPFIGFQSHRGTGLGLAVVARCISAMQGSIAVQSAVGKGSEFTIELPVNYSAKR